MAHTYTATVAWHRGADRFAGGRYGRGHVWSFDGGLDVPASASPLHVPAPYARADAVDPEEAFVAALSSCHMLFFLHLAAGRGLVVDAYRDAAVGRMGVDEAGRHWVEAVTLRPAIDFAGEGRPDDADVAALHHAAHEACYLANSVRTVVTVAAPES